VSTGYDAAVLIADTAKAVDPELRAYPTLREAVTVPALVVLAGEPFATFHERFETDEATYIYDVVLLASKQNEAAAQKRLYGWVDPRGALYRALDAIEGLSLDQVVNVGDYTVGTATYWGGTLRCSYDG
jgi:hypothetical protein